MNAKVRWVIDLSNIYIKRELQAGKFPPGFQQNPQPLDPHRVVENGEHEAVKI